MEEVDPILKALISLYILLIHQTADTAPVSLPKTPDTQLHGVVTVVEVCPILKDFTSLYILLIHHMSDIEFVYLPANSGNTASWGSC